MPANIDIGAIRKDYRLQTLSEEDLETDPTNQFKKWFDEVIISQIPEANAMTLATCNSNGHPSARIVLLKGFSREGFIFFTNYESKKGKELQQNPHVCLVFFWKELERQVRIEGVVKKISATESDQYFFSRPFESRLSAWSSPQSNIIKDRNFLEKNIEHYRLVFADGDIGRPAGWGGYIVEPSLIEFWQGRQNRLHDRLQYTANKSGWKIDRLAP